MTAGWLRGRGCAGHRAALLEFAALRSGGPEVRRALDHVEGCRACEDELATTSLIIHALRRLIDESRRVEPAADGWARLRARLATSRRQPSLIMTCLPGAALALGLVVALGNPFAMRGTTALYDDGPAITASRSAVADGSRFEQVGDGRLAAAQVIPFTWRRQDLPRPSLQLARTRARDVMTRNGVEPAAMMQSGKPDENVPPVAPATWR